MKYFGIAAVSVLLAGVVLAQENSFDETKTNIETCGNFKTPIIVPSKNIDPFIIVNPAKDIDFKLRIINPCLTNESQPIFTQSVIVQPKIIDTFNLKPLTFDVKTPNPKKP